jgi:cytochrome c oxidase subunit 2
MTVRVLLGLVTALVLGSVLWWGSQEKTISVATELSSAGQAALKLAEARGCLVCHSVDGSEGIGPSWLGSYGVPRMLHDGTSVVMDDAYLRRSMQDPAAQVLSGFENVMVPANLSDAEMSALAGLFKELGTGKSP